MRREIEKVREDAFGSVVDLTAKLPARSRFRKDIVPVLAKLNYKPSASFNKKELNKACGVTDSYQRVVKHRASKIYYSGAQQSLSLKRSSMHGFISAERESCSQVERDSIVAWARQQLVVKSGCHAEKFRLQQRKRKVYEKLLFQCAYTYWVTAPVSEK
jgi:hypothetical protein